MANENPLSFLPAVSSLPAPSASGNPFAGVDGSSTAVNSLNVGGTSVPTNPFSAMTGGGTGADPFNPTPAKTNASVDLGAPNTALTAVPNTQAPTPFDSTNSKIVTTTSGAKTKVNALNTAITSLGQANAQPSGYTKDSQGNVYDPTGKYLTLDQTKSLGPNGTPLNLDNLPVGTYTGGAPKTDTTNQPAFDSQGGTILPPGVTRDQNGMLITVNPTTGAQTTVGYNQGGINYNSDGSVMTGVPGSTPTSGGTSGGTANPAFPTSPTVGVYTADQQARIDAAAKNAGTAFDPLIATAQRNKDQGLAKDIVNAGEKGGFMNTQYSGLAALVPDKAGDFVGAGGQLEQQKSAYDDQINSLQIQKNNAIASAKAAMQQYIDTGNQTAYENAVQKYSAAVDASKAQQDAIAQKSQLAYQSAQTDALKNTQINNLAKDQQDYLYTQMAKYPSAFKDLSASDVQNLTPGKINTLITGSTEYKNEILKAHNDALKAGSGLGSGSGVYTPGSNPTIDSWVQNVLNGNATIAQVPSALRSQVSLGITQQPQTSYSPLAASRFATAATKLTNPYTSMSGYQLVVNGQPYLDRIQAALQTPGSVSDQDLLDSLTKLNNNGSAISDVQVNIITGGKSFADTISAFSNKFANGGVLSANQRQQISTIAQNIYDNYKKSYQPIYDKATAQLESAGIPKAFWTIPDVNNLGKNVSDTTGGSSSGSVGGVQDELSAIKPYYSNGNFQIPGHPEIKTREDAIAALKKDYPDFNANDFYSAFPDAKK